MKTTKCNGVVDNFNKQTYEVTIRLDNSEIICINSAIFYGIGGDELPFRGQKVEIVLADQGQGFKPFIVWNIHER